MTNFSSIMKRCSSIFWRKMVIFKPSASAFGQRQKVFFLLLLLRPKKVTFGPSLQNRTVSKQPLSKKMFQNGIFQGQKLLKPISCSKIQFFFSNCYPKITFWNVFLFRCCCKTVQFCGIFDPYLYKKWNLNHLEVIFFQKQFTKTNFSSKFQF